MSVASLYVVAGKGSLLAISHTDIIGLLELLASELISSILCLLLAYFAH